MIVTQAVSLPVSDELAARLQAQSDASGLPAPALAASLLDEGLKTRRYPGIVYKDGPAGRRASLAGGPDVWQVIRALREVPAEEPDPVETVSVEADLHPQEVSLAMRFYKAYLISKDNVDAVAAAGFDHLLATRLHRDHIAKEALEAVDEDTAWAEMPQHRCRAADIALADGTRAVVVASDARAR